MPNAAALVRAAFGRIEFRHDVDLSTFRRVLDATAEQTGSQCDFPYQERYKKGYCWGFGCGSFSRDGARVSIAAGVSAQGDGTTFYCVDLGDGSGSGTDRAKLRALGDELNRTFRRNYTELAGEEPAS